jgi:hypothetical protein
MTTFETHRDAFASHVAELSRMAASQFRHLDPDAKEEAVQNTVALAWQSFRALILKGRGAEPGILKNVLWYSVKQTKVGRTVRVRDDTKPRDVYANARNGRVQFECADLTGFVADDTPVPDSASHLVRSASSGSASSNCMRTSWPDSDTDHKDVAGRDFLPAASEAFSPGTSYVNLHRPALHPSTDVFSPKV